MVLCEGYLDVDVSGHSTQFYYSAMFMYIIEPLSLYFDTEMETYTVVKTGNVTIIAMN